MKGQVVYRFPTANLTSIVFFRSRVKDEGHKGIMLKLQKDHIVSAIGAVCFV